MRRHRNIRPYGLVKLRGRTGTCQEYQCRDCGVDSASKERGRAQGRAEIQEQLKDEAEEKEE